MIGELPETLNVSGFEYQIRTDYRNVLQVFEVFQDPELHIEEKWIVAIYLIFEDFSCADDVIHKGNEGFSLDEAMKQISWFISAGQPEKIVLERPVYNWKQDEQMIFSSINKVAGRETRELDYLHWWTFLGYFNEVGEGTFSFIVGIRNKLNHGKKLEKYEKEFLSRNKELVIMKKQKSKEDQEEEAKYQALWDKIV